MDVRDLSYKQICLIVIVIITMMIVMIVHTLFSRKKSRSR